MTDMTDTTETIALTNAAQILTLGGDRAARAGAAMSELGLLEHATLVIEAGRVAWVGPHAEFTAKLAAGELAPGVTHDCTGAVIMPALVDAHTHLVWAGHRRDELELRLRGADYEQIFAAGGGILSSVRQTRAASEQQLYEQSLRRITRMRSCGATTFEIKSGYGLDLESELRQLRVARRLRDEAGFRIKSTCLAAHAIPEEARGSDDARAAFINRICTEILPAVVGEGLADYADVFCDRGAFTKAEASKVCEAALRLGLELRLHANEFGHTGGAELAAQLRARSADHLLHLSDEERAALREAGVVATLLPGTSLVLGKPYADGRALVEAGVPIAVATDCNPGSCALENLAMVLGLACYGCKLTPAEAIVATTHNAAASLGLADEVGRLAPGLSADLLVIASDDYRDLVYHAGSPLIREVWSRGQRVDRAPA
ncbi:imidazolonepropionase [Enhygromyxa salina]|uniref:Imidazolonepropionase n=1 Tax=Enhygromyxa salina TaxID=215803 RepID=A0A2S9YK74_9BACT|nr:imidazolonepropionase [Enhygromyxa salina]PRQ05483.1 Imidazolonepropionase [Enhygromyxa salina]